MAMALQPQAPAMLFGVVFVRKSFVIGSEAFARADPTHWTLDVGRTAGASYHDVRDVCLFIRDGHLLDNNSALVLYVQAGNSAWVGTGQGGAREGGGG